MPSLVGSEMCIRDSFRCYRETYKVNLSMLITVKILTIFSALIAKIQIQILNAQKNINQLFSNNEEGNYSLQHQIINMSAAVQQINNSRKKNIASEEVEDASLKIGGGRDPKIQAQVVSTDGTLVSKIIQSEKASDKKALSNSFQRDKSNKQLYQSIDQLGENKMIQDITSSSSSSLNFSKQHSLQKEPSQKEMMCKSIQTSPEGKAVLTNIEVQCDQNFQSSNSNQIDEKEFENKMTDMLLAINYYTDSHIRSQVEQFLLRIGIIIRPEDQQATSIQFCESNQNQNNQSIVFKQVQEKTCFSNQGKTTQSLLQEQQQPLPENNQIQQQVDLLVKFDQEITCELEKYKQGQEWNNDSEQKKQQLLKSLISLLELKFGDNLLKNKQVKSICKQVNQQRCGRTVSYTHLTLPTICSVQISVVAVSLKKKKKQKKEVQARRPEKKERQQAQCV
eukprot:TRINITY_DN13324_c0_g1_i1.p1 TRINITY_DN13324_c0_g1~~TRINITY_DN13324_c0_g1_i1.p1  ORF type:complete len:450 (+),score=87.33 TRINITY_DN13324_c0_g1_i1:114-1463(+)